MILLKPVGPDLRNVAQHGPRAVLSLEQGLLVENELSIAVSFPFLRFILLICYLFYSIMDENDIILITFPCSHGA